MADDETYEITDERALKILAHPLRLRLLSLLRADGPSTATALGRRVDESSGVTSYHLRQLANGGFVDEAPELGNQRERWWRAAHRSTRYSSADFLDSPAGRTADLTIRREVLRWQQLLQEQWLAEETTWSDTWVDAAIGSDVSFELTPSQLRAFGDELGQLLLRFRDNPPAADRAEAAEAERVVCFAHAFPTREMFG